MTENKFNLPLDVLEGMEDELHGLNDLGSSMPVIQWFHDGQKLQHRPERGAFVMVRKNIDLAGDFPEGMTDTIAYFAKNKNNPRGSKEEAVCSHSLTFVPLAFREGIFNSDRGLLEKGGNYRLGKDTGNLSRINVLGLFKGNSGEYFTALITVKSTAAGKLKKALREHKERVLAMLRAAYGSSKKKLPNGFWRWCWITLEAGDPEVAGDGNDSATVTPIVISNADPAFMGLELKSIWYHPDEITEFEHSWDHPTAAAIDDIEPDDTDVLASSDRFVMPPEPDFPDDF